MDKHGPFHRLGSPGGPGCSVTTLPVEGREKDGTLIQATLLDAGTESSELEMLRTIAWGLGVKWGHDQFGWWAAVPRAPTSGFAASTDTTPLEQTSPHALYREDDNGVRFLVGNFNSRAEAEQRATELAQGGHKQMYFIEQAGGEAAG